MFNRRPLLSHNPLSADLMATMVQANQLMTQGKPLEAAPLFAQLAALMQGRQHPRRAANLYARAAHAFTDGNDTRSALLYSRQALALFMQTDMPARAASFFANITGKMTNKGMNTEVKALEREFGNQVAAQPAPLPQFKAHGLLPTNCPKCGAPVHGEDVTWVDDHTVECDYCGALIRGE